jgi:hypothetical protein
VAGLLNCRLQDARDGDVIVYLGTLTIMTAVILLDAFNQVDLTEAGPQEDQSFTYWLAQPENIDLPGRPLAWS